MIEYDNTTTKFTFGSSTDTVSHTSDNASFMLIGISSNLDVLTVTVDGDDAEFVNSVNVGTSYYLHVYKYRSPASGTNSVYISVNGSGGVAILTIIKTYRGVIDAVNSVNDSGITNDPDVSVSSDSTSQVIDFMMATDEGTHNSVTAGAGQTERGSVEWNGNYRFVSSDKDGASSTTMTWAIDKTGSAAYTLQIGLSLKKIPSNMPNLLPWG
jgi:hypothetical protein